MIQRSLKKESINNLLKGFTLMELLIGCIVSATACLAIVYSTFYIQNRMYDIKLKERAHEALKGYTDFWKGKIAADDISLSGGPQTKETCLIEEDNACTHQATLKSQIIPIDTGISHSKRSGLSTSIEWESRYQNSTQEIKFYVEQLVLKQ